MSKPEFGFSLGPPTEEQWQQIGESAARAIELLPEVVVATYDSQTRAVNVTLAPIATEFPITIVISGDEKS